jgi:uncharacterized protein YeaO (DUF488 family)
MAIRVVRLGQPRQPGEGLRLGTVRRPPRGVKKEDFAKRNYYDQWLPVLAPSQPLVSWALSVPWTDERWAKYVEDYRKEMSQPVPRQVLELLSQMSHHADFSVGCYCEREERCHRWILRELLVERGAKIHGPTFD